MATIILASYGELSQGLKQTAAMIMEIIRTFMHYLLFETKINR